MLTVGILALFSLGLVGMMGGSDSPEPDEQEVAPEELEVEAEAEVDILEMPDVVDAGLPDTDIIQADPEIPVAEETPEPKIDEPAAEPVLVLMADGSEISDDTVLSDGPLTGENADRSFVLTAPEGEHAIGVEYDPVETYEIVYNEDTVLVSAALNSNVSGPEGTEVSETADKVDADGTPFTETLTTLEFESAPLIILNIDQSEVGAHVAEIDLSNPDATLNFDFTHMRSGVHLVYDEQDTVEGDSFITTRTLYIVETSFDLSEVPEDAMENIIANGIDPENEARLVAEIHLGHSELISQSGSETSGPFHQTIANFINENPNIGTNFFWASDNSIEALEEDDTGPNVWLGVPPEEVGIAPNTGLVLEPGVTYTPPNVNLSTPDT